MFLMLHIKYPPMSYKRLQIMSLLSKFTAKYTFGLTWRPWKAMIIFETICMWVYLACVCGVYSNITGKLAFVVTKGQWIWQVFFLYIYTYPFLSIVSWYVVRFIVVQMRRNCSRKDWCCYAVVFVRVGKGPAVHNGIFFVVWWHAINWQWHRGDSAMIVST